MARCIIGAARPTKGAARTPKLPSGVMRNGYNPFNILKHGTAGPTRRTDGPRSYPVDHWGDVRVRLLREPGEGPLYARGLCRANQLLHQSEPLTRGVEVDYGSPRQPCGDGSSHASGNGALAWNSADS